MASEEGWADVALYADATVVYRYLTSLHWALSMFQGSVEVRGSQDCEVFFLCLKSPA